ncbi:Peroxisomal membrane protein PEX30 [Ceratocystis lukuohia]|uniref:Peroxisomal membrane protein PEX30 n=1 Tax=Ceratocystis lukuohia TaxID=2019550 RepID=A0ABR4MPB1_9PEZI
MSNAKVRPDSLEALTTAGNEPSTGTAPPTFAAFSPASLSTSASKAAPSRSTAKRSTILVHQKSPLLLATPPQITRALAYSHPFLLPLNKLAGLLTWTTGDPWESFLLLAAFWAIVLYGDVILRYAGPIAVVLGLMVGMYSRRFSPLSSSGWSEPGRPDVKKEVGSSTGSKNGHKANSKSAGSSGDLSSHVRNPPAAESTNTRHQKTLDEIVETLKEFTARCDMLLEPMLTLTDFLSTQRTPTSATVRPALTTLFTRILFCTPFWFALTLPPLCIITTRRIVMVFGSLVLSWHSQPMRVCRTILWRSSTVRRTASLVTGLELHAPLKPTTPAHTLSSRSSESGSAGQKPAVESELTKQLKNQSLNHKLAGVKNTRDAGVKFTFIIFENQRRWVGLGWTLNLFGYERSGWTDENNNQVPSREEFELPDVEEGSRMRWRWVKGSQWRVDGVPLPEAGAADIDYDTEAGKMGWVYYDSKWQNGRRGTDGWGRWTRRRKWYRDAELVDIDELSDSEATPGSPAEQLLEEEEDDMAQKLRESREYERGRERKPRHLRDEGNKQQQEQQHQQSSSSGLDRKQRSGPLRASTGGFKPSTLGYSTAEEKIISPMRTEVARSYSPSISSLVHSEREQERDRDSYLDRDADSVSIMSTSSRSFFKSSTLKRRAEQRQSHGLTGLDNSSHSDKASLLGVATELEIHGHGKESRAWGIGDEAHMCLE